MLKSSAISLPKLFHMQQIILQGILDLRLEAFPQQRSMMLLDRIEELRRALIVSVRKIHRRKRKLSSVNMAVGETHVRVVSAIRHLLKLLHSLKKNVLEDIGIAEGCIRYDHFHHTLKFYKKRANNIATDILNEFNKQSKTEGVTNIAIELSSLSVELEQLKEVANKLKKWSHPRLSSYITMVGKIFNLLEINRDLSEVNADVKFILRGIAYKYISSSALFDHGFYADNNLKNSRNIKDGVKHYLAGGVNANPSRFFINSYYIAAYTEVESLRYNALEHFIRYGDMLRYNPGPEFDTIYYLKNNEDVFDANFSAILHFVQHGLAEGRPPSSKSGSFFAGRYIDKAGVSIAFVGDPDEAERQAWDLMHSCCEAQEGGHSVHLPAETWRGNEAGFDAFVIGGAGAARLSGGILRNVAKGKSRLLYLGADPQGDMAALMQQSHLPTSRICAVTFHYERFIRWQESEVPLRMQYVAFSDVGDPLPFVKSLLNRLADVEDFAMRRFALDDRASPEQPLISVVSIIYKKAKEMLLFLESLNRQDLARPYEVVLVNDASPDDTEEQVRQWLEYKLMAGLLNKFMQISILRNDVNSGNCVSRNRGITAAKANIVLVTDGDVVLSTSSLSEHLWAYRGGDCDAIIGFSLFDMNKEAVEDWLAACEINKNIVKKRLLEPILGSFQCVRNQLNSIYNFITRNVSFRKSIFEGKYFDESFGYSSNKNSGYGHEDFEIGARLYSMRRNIRFLDTSVSIHMRHADTSQTTNKSIASLRNWNRLLEKYPDLTLLDRQYYQWRTYNYLRKTINQKDAREFIEAKECYTSPDRTNIVIRTSKPLNILTYAWHSSYQYELFKLNHHHFTLVSDIGPGHFGEWDYSQRPLPRNVRFIPLDAIDLKEYDFAILPFDGSVPQFEHCAALPESPTGAFLTMLGITENLPRTAICFGSPPRYETDMPEFSRKTGEIISGPREFLRTLLNGIHVVCNSHQAQQEWGFCKSSVIWHGFSPLEFSPGSHEKGCLTLSRQAFEASPFRAGAATRKRVDELIRRRCLMEYTAPPAAHPCYVVNSQEWSIANFQNYTSYIGEYAIYINPTEHSPMPRSRGEAMLTGVIPVSLHNHDIDMFIQNGINGFYADSPEEMAEQILWLLNNGKQRDIISRNAYLTAIDCFNIDRHLASWSDLIFELSQ